jgi:hypothetical protein
MRHEQFLIWSGSISISLNVLVYLCTSLHASIYDISFTFLTAVVVQGISSTQAQPGAMGRNDLIGCNILD